MPDPGRTKKLPSPEELVRELPLSERGRLRVERDREEVRRILSGADDRLLVVVGPCSAWPAPAVLEYAGRLKELETDLADTLKVVMRAYIQKPRTACGWTGPGNQPDPFAPPDIEEGRRYARRLMLDVVELGLPIADEAVFLQNERGFSDLVAWVAIGARSTEDQEHRIWASAVDIPVGLKNPTSGCIPVGVNGVVAAQSSHTAVFDGYQVETRGNDFAHLVLRGGAHGPNYDLYHLHRARRLLEEQRVRNPAILVDGSHDNCRIDGTKRPELQADVAREVLDNLRAHPRLRDFVRGFLVESFLKTGNQRLEDCTPETVDMEGLSITDPCLGWEETRGLLLDMADRTGELRAGRSRLVSSW